MNADDFGLTEAINRGIVAAHRDGIVSYGTLARVALAGGAPRQMLEAVKFADESEEPGPELLEPTTYSGPFAR